jgi:hypothetical protein
MNLRHALCGLAAAVLLSFAGKQLYMAITDDFTVAHITDSSVAEEQWEMRPLSSGEQAEVDAALAQEYHYYAKGHQGYVFESRDQKYMLKFLKFKKFRYPWPIDYIPLPPFLAAKRSSGQTYKDNKRLALLTSWQIAFNELPRETGVLFVQLQRKSPLTQVVALSNKGGMHFELPLSDYVFMLQRKADMLGPTVEAHVAEGNDAEAKKLIDKLLLLYLAEYSQGIIEKDPYILRNTGVAANLPIQIDTGRFRHEHPPEGGVAAELSWKTTQLLGWLGDLAPALGLHLQLRLDELEASL